jgi:hypothetical protein
LEDDGEAEEAGEADDAVAVDAAVAGLAGDLDLDEARLAEQALAQALEGGWWKGLQQVDKLGPPAV